MDEYDVTYAIEDLIDEMIRASKTEGSIIDVERYKRRLIEALRGFRNGSTNA